MWLEPTPVIDFPEESSVTAAPGKRPRMTDVGKKAGVSACTVSRAFNAPDTVRPEIRQRILDAAEALNYSLNPSAKALRLQTTHIFGVVIPTLDHALFAKLVHSFQETLSRSGYAPVVVTTGFDNRRVFDEIEMLIERGAEGLLMVGKVEDERVRRFLKRTGIPAVTTYSYVDDAIPSIGFDNYHSIAQAVEYLAALGHRQMAMIAGPSTGNDRQQSRIQAFRDAEAKYAKSAPWPVIEHSYADAYSAGAEVLRDLLASRPDITAVVCNSDTFAISALLEMQRQGVRVPEDLSIIGHDDMELAPLLTPSLSTVAVPASDMGHRCAQALLNAKLHGAAITPVKLDANLIIRGSTGPVRRRRLGHAK